MVNYRLGSAPFLGAIIGVAGCTLSASASFSFRVDAENATTINRQTDANRLWNLPVQLRVPESPAPGGWQMVRTPGPDKSGDIVSMMRTADFLNSDPDFAGMAIRCQGKERPQIAFVVIQPFKPRSKTTVTVATGPGPARFEGIVIGPGSMVALPDEAFSLLRTWQTARTLRVEIASEDLTINGAVVLAGLGEAVTKLETSCPR